MNNPFHALKQWLARRFAPHTRPQLLQLLRQSPELLGGDTLKHIESLLAFEQLAVRDAMMTRAQMDVVKTTDSIERIIAYVAETAHSRFPVIADDKDHVLGILHAKDLLKYTLNPEAFRLESVLRPAVFVPEGKSLVALLKDFQSGRHHMAVVVDEYGGVSGLVTFEDLIEQIVGKIEDEFDEDDSADHIFPVSSERWRIHAATEISDINAFFGTQFSNEEADTIGGLVIQQLGHLPVRGEKVQLGDLLFTVARADNRRLHTLMATRTKDDQAQSDSDN
ncbi:HlyC/CorC family transporter [Conchiformibius steedae]|uniref:HlyC/CorC family transporter n=1 Tax=Conchiformibius steedae TaxID=153493 RepID=UPI00047EF169|nr:CBS domain-containing protein [Conchiformibius steedae]